MKSIGWEEFFERLNMINFEKFDIIIAIGNGGIIPAAFIQQKLKIPMKIIWINYRDEDNKPKYEEPKLDFDIGFALKDKKLLLVDDVLRTGKTIRKAKESFSGNSIKTFVINGEADYNIFNQEECIMMPWKNWNRNIFKRKSYNFLKQGKYCENQSLTRSRKPPQRKV